MKREQCSNVLRKPTRPIAQASRMSEVRPDEKLFIRPTSGRSDSAGECPGWDGERGSQSADWISIHGADGHGIHRNSQRTPRALEQGEADQAEDPVEAERDMGHPRVAAVEVTTSSLPLAHTFCRGEGVVHHIRAIGTRSRQIRRPQRTSGSC